MNFLRTFLPLTLLTVPAAAAPGGAELLKAMTSAEKSLVCSGTLTISAPGGAPMTVRFWRDGARRRLEWTAPPVMAGDVLLDSGRSIWRYHRAENSAVETRGAGEIAWNRFTPGTVGGDKIAGRSAWQFALERGGKPALKIWIDQKTSARLRVDVLGENGRPVSSLAVEEIKFAPVDGAVFNWSPPAGARTTRTNGTLFDNLDQARESAAWLTRPGHLPRGYEFESAVVDPAGNGGRGEAWLRYSNGFSRFSIFQQRLADTKSIETQKADGGWFAQRDGSRFFVVGLPSGDAKKVVESLR